MTTHTPARGAAARARSARLDTAPGGPSSRGGSVFSPQCRVMTIGVLIVVTIIAFEAMAVATALPTAARDLHGLAAYGMAFTGFLVASVIGMVSAGWYSDRRGPRTPLVVGLWFFFAGLAVAAAADQMWVLVAGRVVQGLATGLLLTSMYVVIGSAYADEIRPRIFGAIASAWVVPGLVGPVVAGWVTEQWSWRWVFAGLTPFVLVGAAFMSPTLRQLRDETDRSTPLDYRSGARRIGLAVLSAVGIAAVANLGEHTGAASLLIALLGVAASVIGLRSLLPAGTVGFRPGVPAAVAFRGLLAGTFFGMEALVPLTLTLQHHYSPTLAGVPLMCSAVTWSMASWLQGRLPSPNRARLMGFGLAMIAMAGAGMATVAAGWTPGWAASGFWALSGFGAGLALSSASVVMLAATNDRDRGSDSAALQLADSSMSALCVAFGGALVAAAAHGEISYGSGLAWAFFVLATVAAAAICRAGRLTGSLRT